MKGEVEGLDLLQHKAKIIHVSEKDTKAYFRGIDPFL
jgi:hypothetical protein